MNDFDIFDQMSLITTHLIHYTMSLYLNFSHTLFISPAYDVSLSLSHFL